MELYSFQDHPTTDRLEEYAFERLSGADTEALELHLLVCPECQAALRRVDEFILMIKQASWCDRALPTRSWIRGVGYTVATGLAISGIVAALVIGAGAIRPKSAGGQPPIELLSLRSGSVEMNRAMAKRSMDLRIDLADLPIGRTYRLEIVDGAGRRVWGGEASASMDRLSAYVGKPLPSGQYWVRLYSSEKLVREFGLTAE